MTDNNSKDIIKFYSDLIKKTALELQKKVCDANGIPLNPKTASDILPIPVYEEGPASLLSQANQLKIPTEIIWPAQDYSYLIAYYKRYRINGRTTNQVVVLTDNYCEARFFAAKELMHCFIDDDGFPATNSVPLVNELIENISAMRPSVNNMSPQTIVDELAWIGALDFLIPDTWMPLLIKTHDAIQSTDPKANAILHIAQMIRVPESMLRVKLTSTKYPDR